MTTHINQDWQNQWNSVDDLPQYDHTPVVSEDEKAIFNFVIPYLRSFEQPFRSALDVRTSPTLYHDIALAPLVEELHLADLQPQNLREIRKWIEGASEGHDWKEYIEDILRIEGRDEITEVDIAEREALLKSRITRLVVSDIKRQLPLGHAAAYPLVTAFYVADSIAGSKEEWLSWMGNLASLVEEKGVLIISALRNAEYYKIDDQYFPSASLTEQDVHDMYLNFGFNPSTITVEVAQVSQWKDEGFNSIIMARGQR